MASREKATLLLARQLFRMSVVDGAVSADRVAGVLAYVEKHRPARPAKLLRAYYRLVATELAKSEAVVEHSGPVSDSLLASIAAAMTKRYGRGVTATAKPSPELLAGIRVRVGDDVYEASIAAQLSNLASTA